MPRKPVDVIGELKKLMKQAEHPEGPISARMKERDSESTASAFSVKESLFSGISVPEIEAVYEYLKERSADEPVS